jgi:hypothetical protein
MNLIQLRSIVETVLGYYQYTKQPDGTWEKAPLTSAPGWYYQLTNKVGPAIYVQGSQRVPSNWDPKGLETVIVEVPMPKVMRMVGLTMRTQVWTLYLQQWDGEKTVQEPVNQLLRHFGGEAKATYYRKGDTDLSDRAMIQITSEDVDLENWPTHGNLQEVPSPVENSSEQVFTQ